MNPGRPRRNPQQLGLFGDAASEPDGVKLRHDFLSVEEEATLVARLQLLSLEPFRFRGFTGARLTRSFGWRYDFESESVCACEPIPAFLFSVRERAARWAGVAAQDLAHALVTEYPAGAGIGWHRDKAVFGDVVGISLLSDCVLRFRQKVEGWRRATVNLPARSAYLLRGPAREIWEHSILAAPERRYSITFRTMRAEGWKTKGREGGE